VGVPGDWLSGSSLGVDAKPSLNELKRLESDPQKLVRDATKLARAKIGG
jgi:hypothetical protein